MFPVPLTATEVRNIRGLIAGWCLAALAGRPEQHLPRVLAGQAVALADALIEELGLLPPPPPEDSEPPAF